MNEKLHNWWGKISDTFHRINCCKSLNLCILGNFHAFVVGCWLFWKDIFSKNSYRNTIRVLHSLDQDQNVRPNLGPNSLLKFWVDDKIATSKERVVIIQSVVILQFSKCILIHVWYGNASGNVIWPYVLKPINQQWITYFGNINIEAFFWGKHQDLSTREPGCSPRRSGGLTSLDVNRKRMHQLFCYMTLSLFLTFISSLFIYIYSS